MKKLVGAATFLVDLSRHRRGGHGWARLPFGHGPIRAGPVLWLDAFSWLFSVFQCSSMTGTVPDPTVSVGGSFFTYSWSFFAYS